MLVLVREGVTTLGDEALAQSCERSHELMGIHGFSALEVPDGGFEALARLRPLFRVRRRIMLASGSELVNAGFALLPTMDYPHWTVVVAEPGPPQFARVRALFSAPQPNPVYTLRGD